MKVLILDNFDSFTYNIQHYLESEGVQVEVCRAEKLTIQDLRAFDKIILSPGPGLPKDFPFMNDLLKTMSGLKPILGICLGMQAITEFVGGDIYNLNEVKHGVQEEIGRLGKSELLAGVDQRFDVGLYHSWACRLPENSGFQISAMSDSGVLMAFENNERKLYGVQFHPESVLTPSGKEILKNFLIT